jgi:hypothetical protein
MESARDRAVRLLQTLLNLSDDDLSRAQQLVDAIIDAARAPESAHTRAMAALDASQKEF